MKVYMAASVEKENNLRQPRDEDDLNRNHPEAPWNPSSLHGKPYRKHSESKCGSRVLGRSTTTPVMCDGVRIV